MIETDDKYIHADIHKRGKCVKMLTAGELG